MFDLGADYDPAAPSTDALRAEIGVDVHAVRETRIDGYARHCPEREV